MLDLSFITDAGPVAGAAGRAPKGAGAATPAEAASFLDALAALSALVAADAAGAEAPSTFGDDVVSDEASSAESTEKADADVSAATQAAAAAVTAATGVPRFAEAAPALPAETGGAPGDVPSGEAEAGGRRRGEVQTGTAGTSATAPAAARTAGPVVTGESTSPAALESTEGRLPTLPSKSAPVPAPAASAAVPQGQPAVAATATPATDVAASEVLPESERAANGADLPVATTPKRHHEPEVSAVLDRLRAAQTAAQRSDVAAAAVTAAGRPQEFVTDVPVSQPAQTVQPHLPTGLMPGTAATTQGQRASADSNGEQTSGFGFTGHAAPRTAAPVLLGPSGAPTFASLVNSMQAADVLPAETSNQIVQAIRLQVMREGGEAHIRLDPRQFGDMTVKVRVDQGQVHARVEADAPVVREWLQSNQHVLRQGLAAQQLTLDRLDVQEPPASSDEERREESSAREREQERQRQRGQRQRRPDGGESFEVVA